MPSSSDVDTPLLNCISPVYGTSLEMPPILRAPGTASLTNLFSGVGHIGSITGAAANFKPTPQGPISTLTTGLAHVKGCQDVFGSLTVTGKTLFLGGFEGETSYWKLNSGSWAITSAGGASVTASGAIKLTADSNLALNATTVLVTSDTMKGAGTIMKGFNISACTGKKDFDIPHPTKSGWRLRHVCIEGPTADVFVKGVLNSSNVINLPDYWVGLVDYNTIVVNLTSISVYQELFVDKIENNKVYIKNNSGGMIKCNYLICAERKDVEKNIPEYQGEYQDYPGDNSQYLGSLLKK